jgi:hypothetical protein
MPPSQPSQDVKGPIRDKNAARVCGLNRISSKQEQLVTLRQLRGALETAIHDLEREHDQEKVVNRAFLVVRFTKATCDAFLGMAQTFVETFVPAAKEGAKTVNKVYAVGTSLGDAAGTKMAGGQVDYAKKAIELAKVGVSPKDEGYKLLAKSMFVKAEVIHAAVNHKPKDVQKKAASYLYDMHLKLAEMTLDHAKHTKTKHAVHLLADTAKRAFEYNEALGEIFDGMLEAEEEGDQRYVELRTSLLKQARMLSGKISALERAVNYENPQVPVRLP